MHFKLNLGKAFGGSVVAKPILLWLDSFIRHTLTDLLVWPNRIVVPLSYDPNFDYSILEMRCAIVCFPGRQTVCLRPSRRVYITGVQCVHVSSYFIDPYSPVC